MGTHLWVMRIKIVGTDGEVTGQFRTHKTFPPFPGLHLSHCRIYAHQEDENRPVPIGDPIYVESRFENSYGYFIVDLETDFFSGFTAAERIPHYGSQWKWGPITLNEPLP